MIIMAWDVTVATTLADSYLPASSATAAAASRKEVKYSDLPASFSFQPTVVETLGPINVSAVDFLHELGRRISSKFQDERQTAYLIQRLSVTDALGVVLCGLLALFVRCTCINQVQI